MNPNDMTATELLTPRPNLASLAAADWPAVVDVVADRVPAFVPSKPSLLDTTRAIAAIDGDDTCALALGYAADLQAERKAAEAHFKPYNQAADTLRKRLVELRDGWLDAYKGETDRLKKLVLAYEAEKARKAREEEERLAREARAKAAAERARIEAEAQAEAERLAAEGRHDQAEAVIEQAALDAEDVRAEPIVIAPPAPSAFAGTGAGRRTTWKPEYGNLLDLVVAAAQNPEAYLHYLTWNEKAIAAAVRAQGEACRIPGVKAVAEAGLAIRASR